jgi:hypothetical protein
VSLITGTTSVSPLLPVIVDLHLRVQKMLGDSAPMVNAFQFQLLPVTGPAAQSDTRALLLGDHEPHVALEHIKRGRRLRWDI